MNAISSVGAKPPTAMNDHPRGGVIPEITPSHSTVPATAALRSSPHLHIFAHSITFSAMANSLTKILIHITFSTRNRTPSIPEELEPRLYSYIGGVCRRFKSPLLTMNGTADHVHMLVSLDKNMTIPKLLLHIKRDSSTWMNERTKKRFNWQDGYFAFSIGESGVDALTKYIAKQKQHHKKLTFKEEVEALLAKYKVEYDPKEIWD